MVMDSDDREDFAFQKFPDEALVTLALKYLRGTWTQVAQVPRVPFSSRSILVKSCRTNVI